MRGAGLILCKCVPPDHGTKRPHTKKNGQHTTCNLAHVCSIPFTVINFSFCLNVVSRMQRLVDGDSQACEKMQDGCDGGKLPLLLGVLLSSVAMAAYRSLEATNLIRFQTEHQA